MVLNFVCRASKTRKNGLSPIELSIIIKGERRIITTQRYCKSVDFNTKAQKVKGDKELNNYLESIKNRKKTDVKSVIPILTPVQDILDKYGYQLPIISNQKYNSYLKVLGDTCGTPMRLRSHRSMRDVCLN